MTVAELQTLLQDKPENYLFNEADAELLNLLVISRIPSKENYHAELAIAEQKAQEALQTSLGHFEELKRLMPEGSDKADVIETISTLEAKSKKEKP